MSKKATSINRAATKALSRSNMKAELARLMSRANSLAKDAVAAAAAAISASERCRQERGGAAKDVSVAREIVLRAEEAMNLAVEKAHEAVVAEGEGDVVGATVSADAAMSAAQQAAAFSAAVSVMSSKSVATIPDADEEKPTARSRRERAVSQRELAERELSRAIDRSARYLVTYDGRVIATFEREDDAMLFEAVLAPGYTNHKWSD